jgi:hypothetical protein
MPDIIKITIDGRKPSIIMADANAEDEWRPLSYELLYIKEFPDNDLTRELVQVLLNRLYHVGNGFFRNTLEDIVDIFGTINGSVLFIKGEQDIESSGLDLESNEQDIESSGLDIESSGLDLESSGLDIESSGLDLESSGLDLESSEVESKHSVLDNHELDIKSNEIDIQSIIDRVNIKNDKKYIASDYCRDLSECCTNGQQIRHTIRNSTWTCTYRNNKLVMGDEIYIGRSPLNRFVTHHYTVERPDIVSNANAWNECEYFINGRWRSMYNIQKN